MATDQTVLDEVTDVVVRTLGIQDRAATLTASTALFGSMPELDSLAVLELVTAIEDRFGFTIDDGDITGEVFETIGSLAQFVEDSTDARTD
jgi:acyl carrier protein